MVTVFQSKRVPAVGAKSKFCRFAIIAIRAPGFHLRDVAARFGIGSDRLACRVFHMLPLTSRVLRPGDRIRPDDAPQVHQKRWLPSLTDHSLPGVPDSIGPQPKYRQTSELQSPSLY